MSSTPSASKSSREEKLAQMRASEARSGRQKKLLALLAGFIVIVLAIVGIMAAVSSNSKKTTSGSNEPNASSIAAVQKISDSTFNSVGVGTANNFPRELKGASPLTKNGKPRMIYYGAEYCPFCGMERWSIIAALSRFGSWNSLSGLISSEDSIPTFDFRKAKYSSPYLDLTTYETADQQNKPLQTPPAADNALLNKYDTSSFFPDVMQSGQSGSIPFMIFGGTHGTSGATYSDPTDMQSANGNTIAKALGDTSKSTTKGIVGAANVLSAQICTMTGNKPANVCNSAGVKAAAKAAKISQ